MSKQVLVSETLLAAIQSRHNALENRIDAQDGIISNLVENINAIRGDKQRAQAAELAARPTTKARVQGPAQMPKAQAKDTAPGNGPVEVPLTL